MTVSNLYIPNTQKFLRYYDKITSGHHKTYANSLSLNSLTQSGGSISGNGNEFLGLGKKLIVDLVEPREKNLE
jgi:hypothetical protein